MHTQTLLMASLLLISLAATNAWGDEEADAEAISPDSQPETSNIEGWYEDEDENGEPDDWTFFGMGYESRTSSMNGSATATTTAASISGGGGGGGGGKGKGGGKK